MLHSWIHHGSQMLSEYRNSAMGSSRPKDPPQNNQERFLSCQHTSPEGHHGIALVQLCFPERPEDYGATTFTENVVEVDLPVSGVPVTEIRYVLRGVFAVVAIRTCISGLSLAPTRTLVGSMLML